MAFTALQKKKLLRVALLENDKEAAVTKFILELLDKSDAFSDDLETLKEKIGQIKGEKRDSYTLTEEDKKEITSLIHGYFDKDEVIKNVLQSINLEKIAEKAIEGIDLEKIARKVKVPVVEKVIERIETVKQPIITNEVREVAVLDVDSLPKYGEKFRDGLELLPEGSKTRIEAIEGLREELDEVKSREVPKAINTGFKAFRNLTDVPHSYSGQGNKVVQVKADESGLEFSSHVGGDVDLTSEVTGILPIANGGTGSATQNFVDLTTNQTVEGVKTWSDNAVFNGNLSVGVDVAARKVHFRDDELALRMDRGGANGAFALLVNYTDTTYSTVNQSWLFGSANANDFQISDNGTSVSGVGTARLTIQKDTGYIGIGTSTPSSKLDLTTSSLGTTQTNTSGLALVNTTAAAAGSQQISPAIRWKGYGWKTNATAASQSVEFRNYLLPIQGTGSPSGSLMWQSSINGGSYSNLLSFTTGGRLKIELSGGGIEFFNGATITQQGSTGAVTYAGSHLFTGNLGAAVINGRDEPDEGNGGNTIIRGGSGVSFLPFAPTASGGNVILRGGQATGSGTNTQGSVLFQSSTGSTIATMLNSGNFGIGISPSARLHLVSTTEQQRTGYDASNYYSTTVGSTGGVTFNAVGTGAKFTFSDLINIPTKTPASAAASGVAGDIGWDTDYVYVCTAANTWKRAALTTW